MAHLSQEYHDYLNSPAWKAVRAKVLKRDNYTCRRCGGKGFDAHHLTYERFGRERVSDLETLCRRCHKREHKETDVIFSICQTCGEFLKIVVNRFKDGWTRYTCSDGHIREYRKKRGGQL